jgi:hypothetical protein
MNRYVAALSVVLGVVGLVGVAAVGRGFAQNVEDAAVAKKCSEATLDGTYLFAQNGFAKKGNEQIPFAVAGYDVFDGNGKVRGVSSGNFDGEVFRKQPIRGTYSVKANCTGTVTFRGVGAATQGDVFIAPDGSEFAFVRTNPEDVAAGIDPRVTAKRVAQ